MEKVMSLRPHPRARVEPPRHGPRLGGRAPTTSPEQPSDSVSEADAAFLQRGCMEHGTGVSDAGVDPGVGIDGKRRQPKGRDYHD
jgi:hypothetical protein